MFNDQTVLGRWVREETLPHAKLLTRLREKLWDSLETRVHYEKGRRVVTPAEVELSGVPTRTWCRDYVAYKDGFRVLLEEQRARDQMILMARNKSNAPMSDEEYAEGMASIMAEVLASLSPEQLQEELKKRGMKEPTE